MLLDAAAFVPTNRLDLRAGQAGLRHACRSTRCSAIRPASAACSSATTALSRLRRPWFAGGTVNFATVQGRQHILSPRRSRLRGRHAELPEHPGGRDRPAAPRAHRPRHDPHARALPDRLAARTSCSPCGTATAGRMVRIYGPATTADARRHVTMNFYDPGWPPARLPARRGAGRRRSGSRSAPAASATRARAKRPKG